MFRARLTESFREGGFALAFRIVDDDFNDVTDRADLFEVRYLSMMHETTQATGGKAMFTFCVS